VPPREPAPPCSHRPAPAGRTRAPPQPCHVSPAPARLRQSLPPPRQPRKLLPRRPAAMCECVASV
jgi:hypothetical protein